MVAPRLAPRQRLVLINIITFVCGVGFVFAGAWAIERILADGIVKTIAIGALVTVAGVLFGTVAQSPTPVPEASVGRVRRPFRILGWIVGPLIIITSIVMGVFVVAELRSGSPASKIGSLGLTALGGIVIGFLFIKAARSGRDPFVRRSG